MQHLAWFRLLFCGTFFLTTKQPRDANVNNIVTTGMKNYDGGLHVYQQYWVMDCYSDILEMAKQLVDEVYQQNYNVNDQQDQTPIGRTETLYKNGNKVGATVGNAICSRYKEPEDAPTDKPTDKPILGSGEGCDPASWIGFDGELCGECAALVNIEDNGHTCSAFCGMQGLTCSGAWDVKKKNKCSLDAARLGCEHYFGATSDAICQCRDPPKAPTSNPVAPPT